MMVEHPRRAPQPIGTAVWICAHLVLTARHNVQDIIARFGSEGGSTLEREITDYSIRLYQVFKGPRYVVWEARQIWCSAESDLALLNVELWRASHPEQVNPAVGLMMRALPPPKGSRVAAFGYHSQTADIALGDGDNYHLEIKGVPQSATGIVEDVFEAKRDSAMYNFPCYQVNARFDGGMSGGPVFDEYGHLAGIVSGSLPASEGGNATSYVTSLWPMLRILIDARKAGHPPAPTRYPAIDLAIDRILAVADLSSLNLRWFPGRRLQG